MNFFRIIMSFSSLLFCVQTVAQSPSLILQTGHQDNIVDVSFSPDEKKVMTVSEDRTTKLWDAGTGLLLATLDYHNEKITAATFSPDGKKIASTSRDNRAAIWDATTGKLLQRLKIPAYWIESLAFSPDSKKLVTASLDGKLRIWNVVDGSIIMTFSDKQIGLNKVMYSPDGRMIATTCLADSVVTLWNVSSGKIHSKFLNEDRGISSFEFSPLSDFIMVTDFHSTYENIHFWNILNGQQSRIQFDSIENIISSGLSADGKYVCVATSNKMVKIFELNNYSMINSFPTESSITKVRFTPDGKQIAVVMNNTVRLYDVQTGHSTATTFYHQKNILALCFSKDGDKIVTGSSDATAKLWEADSGNLLQQFSGIATRFYSIAYSPDGKKIASSGMGSYIWDRETGQKKYMLSNDTGWVSSIAYSKDGSKIVTASFDSSIQVWDAVTRKELRTIRLQNSIAKSVEFSPDGKSILALMNRVDWADTLSGDIKIWEVETGAMTWSSQLNSIYTGAESIQYSPNGKQICVAAGNSIYIVTIQTTIVHELKGHERKVRMARFNHSGSQIVSASMDSSIKIWDLSNRKIVFTSKKHIGPVVSATFSPDDKFVVSASLDKSIKIWDAHQGRLKKNIPDNSQAIYAASFSPDGKNILSLSLDQTARIWDASTGSLIYTFYSLPGEHYFGYLPIGFYQGTQEASKNLHFVSPTLEPINFDQFDVQLNRPDIVLAALGCQDRKLISYYRNAWEKRIKKLGFNNGINYQTIELPHAEIKLMPAKGVTANSDEIILHIKGLDHQKYLDRFNVWVNGVPLFGQKGSDLKLKNIKKLDTLIIVKLTPGNNRIEAAVINSAGLESLKKPITQNYRPTDFTLTNTWFIGIGIDSFIQSDYNLKYSTNDIRSLVNGLLNKEGKMGVVFIDTLFNRDVTIENIRSLKTKLYFANENDRIIIAYSGHGLLDEKLGYFLSTYDMDFQHPEKKGISYELLESLLDSIAPRKKLLLLDACHSGEVDQDEKLRIADSPDTLLKGLKPTAYEGKVASLGMENSFSFMQKLFVNVERGTGSTVIAAAAGNQYALEKDNLKHGVFTFSVLSAIYKYPTMRLNQLKRYTNLLVPYLTDGRQQPISRNENIIMDWDVW